MLGSKAGRDARRSTTTAGPWKRRDADALCMYHGRKQQPVRTTGLAELPSTLKSVGLFRRMHIGFLLVNMLRPLLIIKVFVQDGSVSFGLTRTLTVAHV